VEGILPSFSDDIGTLIVGDMDKSGGQWLGRSKYSNRTYGASRLIVSLRSGITRCLICSDTAKDEIPKEGKIRGPPSRVAKDTPFAVQSEDFATGFRTFEIRRDRVDLLVPQI
jgi:hypothetical protein